MLGGALGNLQKFTDAGLESIDTAAIFLCPIVG
jgi:hypothetical protein